MGHIRALEEDLKSIGLENDFEPSFQFLKEKSKAIAQLKDAAATAERVYLAADDDREGEAIAYSVALLLKLPIDSTPRAVFHEITEKAVKDAIQNPRRIDMHRVYAQQCRAMLDLMVGFTISPLLWNHVGRALILFSIVVGLWISPASELNSSDCPGRSFSPKSNRRD